jgi:uncharacterized protein (TIGR03435 family)
LALTKDGIIQKLLADEEVVLSPEPSTKHDVAWLNGTAEQELPLTLISIAPHQPNLPFPAGGEASDDCMVGYTLPRLIGRFSDVQPAQVVFEGMQPDDRKFDMRLRWPRPDPARHKQTAQAVLETTFGIKIKTGSRQLEVLTLTVRTDAHQEWEPQPVGIFYDAETGLSAADKEVLERMKKGERFFVALGGTTALAHNLSSAMGRPVIDEAHIDGSYSFWFPWDYETNSAEEAKRQVEEKYGVILTPAEREIDVLVVRPAGMGTPHSP